MSEGNFRGALLALTLGAAFSSCGSGSLGLASSSSSSGGAADPTIGVFPTPPDAKSDRAALRFRVNNAGATVPIEAILSEDLPCNVSNLALTELYVDQDSTTPVDLDQVAVAAGSLDPNDPNGPNVELYWDWMREFAAMGIDCVDTTFRVVRVEIGVPGSNAASTNARIGNDAPRLEFTAGPDAGESVPGEVAINVTGFDSSGDPIDVEVQFREVTGDPVQESDWRPATSFLDNAFATFQIVPADPVDGTSATPSDAEVYTWDSDEDLKDKDSTVQLRLIPHELDGDLNRTGVTGATVPSNIFEIDNNAAPVVELANAGEGTDRRGGIRIPFQVADDDGDETAVIVQWRTTEGQYPSLSELRGRGAAQIASDLANDPDLVDRLQIARQLPTTYGGTLGRRNGEELLLPELENTASPLRTALILAPNPDAPNAIGTRTPLLKFPRPWQLPKELDLAEPGAEPVGVASVGDGTTALVLHQPASESGMLLHVDLTTGETLSTQTSYGGDARAIAVEPQTASSNNPIAWLGTNTASGWWLTRVQVDLAAGEAGSVVSIAVDEGPSPSAQIRDIASPGPGIVYALFSDELWRFDRVSATSQFARLIHSDFGDPRAVSLDPTSPGRLIVADADKGLLQIHAVTGTAEKLIIGSQLGDSAPIGEPIDVTVLPGLQNRLLVVDQVNDGSGVRRRLIELRDREGVPLELAELASFSRRLRSLTFGPNGLRLMVTGSSNSPDERSLMVWGGVRRSVRVELVPGTTSTVRQFGETPDPLPSEIKRGDPWTMEATLGAMRTRPGFTSGALVWDSAQLNGAGEVTVRIVPLDEAIGVPVFYGSINVTSAPAGTSDIISLTPIGNRNPTEVAPQIAAVDLDADGDKDLVVPIQNETSMNGCSVAGKLHVLLATPRALWHDEAGNPPAVDALPFDSSQSFVDVEGCGPVGVAAGDLDQDGQMDLIVVNSGMNEDCRKPGTCESGSSDDILPGVDLFEWSDGLVIRDSVSTSTGGFDLAAADLDGDGFQDIVTAHPLSNELTFFWGDGSSNSLPDPTPVSTTLGSPWMLDVADVDRDGDLDICWADTLPDSDSAGVVVVSHMQAGTVVNEELWATAVNARDLMAVDLVNDGYADVAVSAQEGILLVRNDASGPSTDAVQQLGQFREIDEPYALAATDFNRDGQMDLSATMRGADIVAVFLQNRGKFGIETDDGIRHSMAIGTPDKTPRPDVSVVTDFDLDGWPDLVTRSRDGDGQNRFGLLRSEGQGGLAWSSPEIVGGFGQTESPIELAFGDLDGNGLLDIVVAEGSTPGITIEYQVRPGQFRPDVRGSIAPEGPCALGESCPVTAVVADLDGSDYLDVAFLNVGTGNLFVVHDPGANFAPFDFDPIALGGSGDVDLRHLEARDIDLDGKTDLLIGDAESDQLILLLQDEGELVSGTPSPLSDGTISNQLRGFTLAYLDDDNVLDVVATRRVRIENNDPHQGVVLAFGNSEATTFSTCATLPNEPSAMVSGPLDVVWLDVTGDGIPDLVTADEGNQKAVPDESWSSVSIYPGLAPSSACTELFGDPIRPLTYQQHSRVADLSVGDYDLDGDLDILAGEFYDGFGGDNEEIWLFEQVTPGNFELREGLVDLDAKTFEDEIFASRNRVATSDTLVSKPAGTQFIDLDGDGDLDVIWANGGDANSIAVVFNRH